MKYSLVIILLIIQSCQINSPKSEKKLNLKIWLKDVEGFDFSKIIQNTDGDSLFYFKNKSRDSLILIKNNVKKKIILNPKYAKKSNVYLQSNDSIFILVENKIIITNLLGEIIKQYSLPRSFMFLTYNHSRPCLKNNKLYCPIIYSKNKLNSKKNFHTVITNPNIAIFDLNTDKFELKTLWPDEFINSFPYDFNFSLKKLENKICLFFFRSNEIFFLEDTDFTKINLNLLNLNPFPFNKITDLTFIKSFLPKQDFIKGIYKVNDNYIIIKVFGIENNKNYGENSWQVLKFSEDFALIKTVKFDGNYKLFPKQCLVINNSIFVYEKNSNPATYVSINSSI